MAKKKKFPPASTNESCFRH